MKSYLSRLFPPALPVLALCLLTPPVWAEPPSFEGSVTLSSDYRYRGFSQTLDRPALQVGADVTWNSFSFFFWGSNVDFGDGLAEYELDLGLSWSYALSDEVSLSLGAVHYFYVGDRAGDYSEFLVGLEWGSMSFGITVAPDYFGAEIQASYFELGQRFELPRSFEMNFHVGYNAFENEPYGLNYYAEYFDVSLSLSRAWPHMALQLTLGSAEPLDDTYFVAALTFPF